MTVMSKKPFMWLTFWVRARALTAVLMCGFVAVIGLPKVTRWKCFRHIRQLKIGKLLTCAGCLKRKIRLRPPAHKIWLRRLLRRALQQTLQTGHATYMWCHLTKVLHSGHFCAAESTEGVRENCEKLKFFLGFCHSIVMIW
jgi:hypothetical protein